MVYSACSVSSIYSMNTCFMEEYDLPINLPQSISFADGRRIDYLYAASGEKLRETYTTLDGLCDRTRYWAGPWEFVDGQPDRLLTPQGYIDPQGTLHAYIPDYQGNILAVVNTASGALEQSTDYYPYGLPHADAAGADRNRRKFGAKELISEYALHEYDFSARRLPAIIPAFSQPDPLAEKYHWLSPYAYCAADPINLIDPTGMKIDLSQLSDDDLEIFNKWLSDMTSNAHMLFQTLYSELEDSEYVYNIQLKKSISFNGTEVGGTFTRTSQGGDITLLVIDSSTKGKPLYIINPKESIEEFFHAYQWQNKELYKNGDVNLEFEAKLFSHIAYQYGPIPHPFISIDPEKTEYRTIDFCLGKEPEFLQWFYSESSKFVTSYKKLDIPVNSHYPTPTNAPPASLIKNIYPPFIEMKTRIVIFITLLCSIAVNAQIKATFFENELVSNSIELGVALKNFWGNKKFDDFLSSGKLIHLYLTMNAQGEVYDIEPISGYLEDADMIAAGNGSLNMKKFKEYLKERNYSFTRLPMEFSDMRVFGLSMEDVIYEAVMYSYLPCTKFNVNFVPKWINLWLGMTTGKKWSMFELFNSNYYCPLKHKAVSPTS